MASSKRRPMTLMNLVLFEHTELSAQHVIVFTDARAVHLQHVLRVSPGSTVRVGQLDGPLGVGTVTIVRDGHVEVTCELEETIPDRPRVDILLALPRPKVMRRLWAQLAALGVGRIMLTNADKVERDYFDTHLLRPEGYRPLLIEGLQQAKDTRLPEVTIHKQFRKLVESELDALCPTSQRFVAHPFPSGPSPEPLPVSPGTGPEGAVQKSDAPSRTLIAVGPEGGWNDFELATLHRQGFVPFSLGPRTLTTTTACIALLTLAHHACLSRTSSTPAD